MVDNEMDIGARLPCRHDLWIDAGRVITMVETRKLLLVLCYTSNLLGESLH